MFGKKNLSTEPVSLFDMVKISRDPLEPINLLAPLEGQHVADIGSGIFLDGHRYPVAQATETRSLRLHLMAFLPLLAMELPSYVDDQRVIDIFGSYLLVSGSVYNNLISPQKLASEIAYAYAGSSYSEEQLARQLIESASLEVSETGDHVQNAILKYANIEQVKDYVRDNFSHYNNHYFRKAN